MCDATLSGVDRGPVTVVLALLVRAKAIGGFASALKTRVVWKRASQDRVVVLFGP